MYFLGLFSVLGSWLSKAAGEAGGVIEGVLVRGIRTLCYWIDTFVYDLIIKLYAMFETLCTTRLLSSSTVSKISDRVGALLGLIMLFVVIFSFIKMLVDPDSFLDKQKGAVTIIKKVILVIVMLGVSNFVFEALFYVQKTVITSGAISKILLPSVPTYNGEEMVNKFGGLLAEETLYAFYHIDVDTSQIEDDSAEYSRINYCRTIINDLRSEIVNNNASFYLGYICLNESVSVNVKSPEGGETTQEVSLVDFNGPLSVIVGIALVYFLFMYCIKVGMRMLQILALEIMSPMAIVSYLSPKQDNMFSKWAKLYIATYIDVFIRVAIINLAIMLISALFAGTAEAGKGVTVDFWKDISATGNTKYFYVIVMVLALMAFAKKAPELIKDLLPASASKLGFGGLGIKDFLGLDVGLGLAGRGVGFAVGGVTNSAIGMLDRGVMAHRLGKRGRDVFGATMSGFGSGWINAFGNAGKNKGQFWKNIPAGFKAQHESDISYENLIASGGSASGKLGSTISSFVGETSGQYQNRLIANANQMADFRKQARDAADEMSFVKSAKDAWENAVIGEHENQAHFEARKNDLYQTYTSRRNAAIQHSLGDSTALDALSAADSRATGRTIDYQAQIASDSTNSYEFRHIQSIHAQARQYSESRLVQYYDASGNIHYLGTGADSGIGAYNWLNGLGDMAKDNELYITSNPNMRHAYHTANDVAAGVADKRKFGPSGGKNN